MLMARASAHAPKNAASPDSICGLGRAIGRPPLSL